MCVYVVDRELEEFQQFCFMVKPLKNRLKVHLHGLQLDLRKAHSQLKPSEFGYNSDEEDSDEADDEGLTIHKNLNRFPQK